MVPLPSSRPRRIMALQHSKSQPTCPAGTSISLYRVTSPFTDHRPPPLKITLPVPRGPALGFEGVPVPWPLAAMPLLGGHPPMEPVMTVPPEYVLFPKRSSTPLPVLRR